MLEFFNVFIDLLNDDYRRCICFIRSKKQKNETLSLYDIFRLTEEIKNGSPINNINDVSGYNLATTIPIKNLFHNPSKFITID